MSGRIVVDSATVKCSKCENKKKLTITSTVNVDCGRKCAATIENHLPIINVPSFGTCEVTGIRCFPITLTPWSPDADCFVVASVPILVDTSKLDCILGGEITIKDAGHNRTMIDTISRSEHGEPATGEMRLPGGDRRVTVIRVPSDVSVDHNISEVRERMNDLGSDLSGILPGVPDDLATKAWWANKVRPGGAWDYKQRIPAKHECLRQQYANLGNFNYGATGAAAGISLPVLLAAGGGDQGAKNLWQWIKGKPTFPSDLETWFDNPEDHFWIKEGYKSYKRKYG